MAKELETLPLAEEHRLICEKARRCLAEAQALMVRLDHLDSEWARAAKEYHPCSVPTPFNQNTQTGMQSVSL